jgi:hypothetical protein
MLKTCTDSHWFDPRLLRHVVDGLLSIALLAGWLASDDELKVAERRGKLMRLPRGGAGGGAAGGAGGSAGGATYASTSVSTR